MERDGQLNDTEAGAKVELMEPADRRAFARVANKHHTAGFYANIIFELDSAHLPALEVILKERPEVFRYQVIQTAAPEPADDGSAAEPAAADEEEPAGSDAGEPATGKVAGDAANKALKAAADKATAVQDTLDITAEQMRLQLGSLTARRCARASHSHVGLVLSA